MQDKSQSARPGSARVLQVITPSRMGGAEMLLARLAPRHREINRPFHIVCNSTARGRDALQSALSQHGIPMESLPIGGKGNPRALLALRSVAKRTGSQLSHSHLSSASWWCGWLDRFGILPSVGHVHGFTSAIFHRNQRQLIANTNAVKDHLVQQGIDAKRIRVIHYPVAPEDTIAQKSSEQVRQELGIPTNAPLVGCFAGLLVKKGWHEWIEAIPTVLKSHPQTHFMAVGEGPLRAELEARVAQLGIGKQVHFLGFRWDVPDLMNAMDIMALPSHREPFGLVYVEAALQSKPSIACNAGGAPDAVADGQTGLLVPPRNAPAFAKALEELIGNPERAAEMGRNGYEMALEKFAWSRFLAELDEVYAATLK